MDGDDQKTEDKTAKDDSQQPAAASTSGDSGASSTGTVFAPASADPAANPYDLTQASGSGQQPATPPPVFAEAPTSAASASTAPQTPAPAATPTQASDLMEIKQQALQNLTPLIDELQQSPEDKFRTMMMLIQASDNSQLIKNAYDAANAIKDEKARAQALLDVVNEINYFTQQSKNAK